jgi:hypothetical protein
MADRDLKLARLRELPQITLPQLKTAELLPTAMAFAANALGAKSLALFPLVALHVATRKEQLRAAAYMQVFGELEIERIDRSHQRYQEFMSALDALWNNFGGLEGADFEKELNRALVNSVTHIQSMIADQNVRPGLETWMAAQITGAWTAFETLTGDLWEASLNCHPAGLSDLKGKTSGENKSVHLRAIQQFKYDLSKSMGTLLKEKHSFDRLEDIRFNYSEAFFEDRQQIDTILADKSIDTLSVTRHLMVHRGGIVDQKYLDRTKNLPNAPRAPIGQPVQLDGEIILNLSGPVMKLGLDLIIAVDNWLASH